MLLIFLFIILLTYWIIVQTKMYRELDAKLKNFPEKTNNFMEIMRNYPTTLKVWFGSKVVIVINNPEDIKTILTSPDCTDKSSIYRLTIGGDGLFITNGNKWRNQRRLLNSTFSHRILNSYTNEFNRFGRNIVDAVREHAHSGKEFDIMPIFGIHTTDLITRTIYGSTRHKLENSKHWYQLIESLMTVWGKRMLQIYFHVTLVLFRKIFRIPSEDKKLNKELRAELQPIFDQKIEEYQNNLKSHGKPPNRSEHFLEKLTQLRFEGAISIPEYRHTSISMIMAGTETTSRSLSIIILLLAIHEEYQRKIYDEICNVFDGHGSDDIDISKLNELNLLDRFIKETFRIIPVVPFLGRTTSCDISITEGVIPANTDIFISMMNVHQRSDIWGKNAKKFNPDNFLPEAEANRNKCSYLPFSYGPRNCIGFKFAQFSMYIGIVYLLRNYQFKTTLKMEDIKLGHGMTSYLLVDNLVRVQTRNFNKNECQ